MAINTPNDRASILGDGITSFVVFAIPSGSIAAMDRLQDTEMYRGSITGVPESDPPVGPVSVADFLFEEWDQGDKND